MEQPELVMKFLTVLGAPLIVEIEVLMCVAELL